MEKTFWKAQSDDVIVTDYKCPHCNKGLLKISKERLVIEEYKYSKKNHAHPDMSSDWVESSCSGVMQCNYEYCSEFVAFCGDARGDDIEFEPDDGDYSFGRGYEYVDKINIKYISPSPNLIGLNDNYPEIVKELLKESFCLYWSSPSSCANKLRVIVEEVLNERKIPKRHKTKKNKIIDSNTHYRITRLGKIAKYKEASEYLLAVKEIGNPASHASKFNEKVIIPAYKLLDKALDILYVGNDKDLQLLKNLAKSKKLT
ncbi:DUF4145 domain-containing protein [Crenobacter sp. SG2305]|uniref:DUF4145 domain-containing protein n=1 Tax=Crenobacter oryzisoli TaxID=3056844 RepID=UPI0025AA7352|nr:DUF4145 domain-containing protein [Crenobacter sp. SG2305]MDN0081594.1 DUF4145 domain-containing protein [Crenobacter sp. SG2305]